MLGHLIRMGLSAGDGHRLATFGLTPAVECYRLYRGVGDSLANVDFTTPVATVHSAMSAETFVGLTHAASTKYTYVLRPVLNGLEMPSIACRVLFETDGSGEWIGLTPASPQTLSATAKAGGTVRLSWSYRTAAGKAAPATFGVYYGTSPAIVKGTPQATVAYTADGRFFHILSLTDGVAYWFAVTALSATGKESSLSNVFGPIIADAAAPPSPSVTITTGF
jgi:hypothetical protein